MTTWEYKCFYSDRENYKGILKGFKPGKLEKDLNELGREGWCECGSYYFQESN